MNRDEIIRMAREATGGILSYDSEGEWRLSEKEVERFAELIVLECLNIMNNCDGDLNFAIWKTKKDFEIN